MENLKVWIHTRVSNVKERELLIYQKELLSKIAKDINMEITGISHETSKGIDANSNELTNIKNHATKLRQQQIDLNDDAYSLVERINSCRHDFDVLLVYDKTRILIYDDLFAEFKMICEMNDVCILTYQELEKLFLK